MRWSTLPYRGVVQSDRSPSLGAVVCQRPRPTATHWCCGEVDECANIPRATEAFKKELAVVLFRIHKSASIKIFPRGLNFAESLAGTTATTATTTTSVQLSGACFRFAQKSCTKFSISIWHYYFFFPVLCLIIMHAATLQKCFFFNSVHGCHLNTNLQPLFFFFFNFAAAALL